MDVIYNDALKCKTYYCGTSFAHVCLLELLIIFKVFIYLFIYLFLDPSYAYVCLLCFSFQSSDQLPLSRSSSQEVEQQHLDDPQPVAAVPAPVVSPATVVPPVPVEVPASVPSPVQVPVPVSAPVVTSQPMEQDSVASSSSAGEAGTVMPGAMPGPYLYPMMIPPYYHPAFVPVPCYGYVPFYYGPPGAAQAPHEVVKPVAVHSTPPLYVKDLYNMSELSLKGDSDANGGVPASPLPPKPIGRPERQSAFHGKGPTNGSSGGLIPVVK
jgi:hypothetical protein